MKQINILFILILILSSGCQRKVYELDIPESNISLESPDENAVLDLNNEEILSYTFSWNNSYENGNAIILSSSPYLLKDTVLIYTGNVEEYTINVLDADAYFSALGIGGGKEGQIYWSVKPADNLSVAATEIRSFTAKRIKTQLISPEDQTLISLNVDTPEDGILFSWENEDGLEDEYQLYFSLNNSMNDKFVTFDVGSVNEYTLTHQQLQDIITQLPISLYGQNIIYWNVRRKTNGEFVSRSSNVIKVNGMLVFTDIRGDEKITYRVSKIKYSTGEEVIWLAENLRTVKYPDGSDLSVTVDYWNAPIDISEELQNACGKYYSIGIVDKIVPEGWKVPTFDEYKTLLNESILAGSANVLKHNLYWNWGGETPEIANRWGIGFVPSGYIPYLDTGVIYNYNGNPNDCNCYLLTSDLKNQVVLFSDYGMNVKELYNVDAWGGAPIRLIYVGK